MLHTVLIALHALAGVVALVTGAIALRAGQYFDVHLVSLTAMTVFLTFAVVAEWTVLDAGGRALFTVFALLAVVMVVRGVLARRLRPVGRPSPGYVEHVGFNLIALLDAFVVIAVLNAGAPIWLVVTSGVVLAVAGHFALRRTKQLLVGEPSIPVPVRP